MKKKCMKRSAARFFYTCRSEFKPIFREITVALRLGVGLGLICNNLLLGMILGAVLGVANIIVQVGA